MLAEVLIKGHRKGYTIIEFPVEMIKRSGGVATAGSFKAALQTSRDLFSFFLLKKIFFFCIEMKNMFLLHFQTTHQNTRLKNVPCLKLYKKLKQCKFLLT